jgi:hypothetical protein
MFMYYPTMRRGNLTINAICESNYVLCESWHTKQKRSDIKRCVVWWKSTVLYHK